MENSKVPCLGGAAGETPVDGNPNSQSDPDIGSNAAPGAPPRTPFTSLSQVDADLALARTLQEQERAYMLLRLTGEGGESSETGSYLYEEDEAENDLNEDGDMESRGGEDAFDVQTRTSESEDFGGEINPSAFDSDEAYARALQDAEEREVAVHFMASLTGINNWEAEEPEEEHENNSQDAWQEFDPDELSYEELLALGEVVGTESRGLSAEIISSLPSISYKAKSSQDGNIDQCVICRLDYEDGETLVELSCKHLYHPECINNWLHINKVFCAGVPCLHCGGINGQSGMTMFMQRPL